MLAAVVVRAVGLCVVALMASAIDVQAQTETTLLPRTQEYAMLGRLRLPAIDSAQLSKARVIIHTPTAPVQQQAPSSKCRRGRRAVIGALIGAAGAVPLAVLAHTRWENEAANGTAAAATAVALGAAAGAFIGLATCG